MITGQNLAHLHTSYIIFDKSIRTGFKQRRKGIIKAAIDKIVGKKKKSNDNKPIEKKQIIVSSSVKLDEIDDTSILLPVYEPDIESDVVKKSTLMNSNTVLLYDKVAICVSAKNKANVGDQVNIYFATEASKADIVKLIASNQGYTKNVTGEKIIDINHDDLVKIRVDSSDLTFSGNEFEFFWRDYTNQKFYEYFSFQINEVFKTDGASLTVQLYINNEITIDVQVAFK